MRRNIFRITKEMQKEAERAQKEPNDFVLIKVPAGYTHVQTQCPDGEWCQPSTFDYPDGGTYLCLTETALERIFEDGTVKFPG